MHDILYFSYGSNMDSHSMINRCPDSIYISKGYLDDHDLAFTNHIKERKRTGADIVYKKGKKVWGLIYKISEKDLQLLDSNKVYPQIYNRSQVTITTLNEENLEHLFNVWTYNVNDKSLLSDKAEKDYIDLLIKATIQHGFPTEYLDTLKSFTF